MNKLEVGQMFKNYKAICEWLNVEPSAGNSKTAHIKEFERYCKYHKNGQKYIIDEVYDNPLPKIENRGSDGNSKYYDNIEITLLYLLQRERKRTIVMSVGKILEVMNMINQNYRIVKNNIEESSEILNVSKENMYLFFNTYHSPLINIFRNNLKTMANKSLVYYNDCQMVAKLKAQPVLNELGEIVLNNKGIAKIESKEIHTIATEEEYELILKCEKEILDNMNYKDKQAIFLAGRWQEFNNKVTEKLYERGNIKYYYDAFKIICNRDGIDKFIRKYQYEVNKLQLNTSVINKLKTSIDKKYDDNKITDNYVKDSNILINTVIDESCQVDMKQKIYDKKNCTFQDNSIYKPL